MKNRIITGLVVIMLSCLLASHAHAFHSNVNVGIKTKSKGGGLVFISVLKSRDFDVWDSVSVSKEGGGDELMKRLYCNMSLCLYGGRFRAGEYSVGELKKVTHIYGYPYSTIETLTVPMGNLGKFQVEAGKLTNLGVHGIIKGMNSDRMGKIAFDYGSFKTVRYADHMSAGNAAYINQAITGKYKGFSTDSVLGWNPGGGFEKMQSLESMVSTLFHDFVRAVPDSAGNLYLPTTLGSVYILDAAGNYGQLETGVNLRLHAVYAEKDFYLLGGDAGKLYSYKPGEAEARIIGEFGKSDVVTDILKHGDQYYAIVLSDGYKVKAYRFSNPEAPVFEKPLRISGGGKPLFENFDVAFLRNYQLEPADGGFFLKLGDKSPAYFDFATGKAQKIKFSDRVERVTAPGDGSLIVVSHEEKIQISPASANEDTGEVQLQIAPAKKRTKKTKMVEKPVSALMLSRDRKKWETLAVLNGDIVSNACFTEPLNGYLVLRRTVFDRGRGQYDYAKSQLFKTADGGKTWEEVAAAGAISGDNFELGCKQGKLVLVDRDVPTIQISKDGGKTWALNTIYYMASAIEKAGQKTAGK